MVHAICGCYRLEGNDAAEVNEVVWLRLAESLAHIRRPDAVGSWLAAVTRGQCLRLLQVTGRSAMPPDEASDVAPAWNDSRLDPRLVPDESGRALVAALAALDVRCRQLLRLLAVEPRLTPDEIGAALGMRADEVAPACDRCHDQLRAALGGSQLDDRALLGSMHKVVAAASPLPEQRRQAALQAAEWLASDAQVADLAYDSAVGPGRPSGTRGIAAGHRSVSYTVGPRSVRLELALSANQLVVEGEVRPAGRVRVTALTPGGRVDTETGDEGLFHLDELPRRPISFVVGGTTPFKTGWIVL